MEGIIEWLELNGFIRASTVREPGEYAVRGGILDLFPPGMDMPVRLDFFGDTLETIRTFDPQTQRSEMQLRGLDLVPVAEFQLITETIRKFRTGYVAAFGAAAPDDLLYEAVSEGRRYPGMEHWLPLFHDKLETLFDYLPGTPLVLEHAGGGCRARTASRRSRTITRRASEALKRRRGAALQAAAAGPALSGRRRMGRAAGRRGAGAADAVRRAGRRRDVIDVGAHAGHNFAAERAEPGANVFEAVSKHVLALQAAGKRVADRAVERGRARAHEPRAGRPRVCTI